MTADHVNTEISTTLHLSIPSTIMRIVEGSIKANEYPDEILTSQHNREILDEIIEDLTKYASTLPSVSDLESCNVL